MNTDEKIAAILRMEADTVEPSAAGYDVIKSGIEARRRRTWWLRGSAFAATALGTAAALVVLGSNPTPQSVDQTPASPGPSVTAEPSPSATAAPTVAPKPDAEPLGAVWPLTTYRELREWQADTETYPSLSAAQTSALGFARNYLLSPDATVTAVEERGGSFFFEMRRGTIVVSTLELKGFGDGGTAPYLVVAARSEAVAITAPVAGAAISSPLRASGTYQGVEPGYLARLRADGPGSAPEEIGEDNATFAPPNTWSAEVGFTTTRRTGSLMVTMLDGNGDGYAAAAVVPVTFAAATATPAGDGFAGIRNKRVAVFGPTGTFQRYLIDEQPGGGPYTPDVSPDGTRVVWSQGNGTCSEQVLYAPAAGGDPVTIDMPDVSRLPVWLDDRRIAFANIACDDSAAPTTFHVHDTVSGETRMLTSSPEGVLTLATSPDGTYLAWIAGSTIYTWQIGSGAVRSTPPQNGCHWRAVDVAGTTTTKEPILVALQTCDGVGTATVERFARTAPDRDRVAEVKHDAGAYRVSFDAPSATLLVSHTVEDATSYVERIGRDGKVTKIQDVYAASW